jgi:hypothetical protein
MFNNLTEAIPNMGIAECEEHISLITKSMLDQNIIPVCIVSKEQVLADPFWKHTLLTIPQLHCIIIGVAYTNCYE